MRTVITGPTGSGKTLVSYAITEYLMRQGRRCISADGAHDMVGVQAFLDKAQREGPYQEEILVLHDRSLLDKFHWDRHIDLARGNSLASDFPPGRQEIIERVCRSRAGDNWSAMDKSSRNAARVQAEAWLEVFDRAGFAVVSKGADHAKAA